MSRESDGVGGDQGGAVTEQAATEAETPAGEVVDFVEQLFKRRPYIKAGTQEARLIIGIIRKLTERYYRDIDHFMLICWLMDMEVAPPSPEVVQRLQRRLDNLHSEEDSAPPVVEHPPSLAAPRPMLLSESVPSPPED